MKLWECKMFFDDVIPTATEESLFSCPPFQEQGRNRTFPRAMERKGNVQCTFLENRRAGALENF